MSVSAKAVLFADGDPARTAGDSSGWRQAMQRLAGPLAKVAGPARAAVERELSAALSRLLEQDLGHLIVAGLRHHPKLEAAARSTAADPNAVEVVQLMNQQVTSSHHPYVDIVVDGDKLATVHFDLDLTFDIDTLAATVRSGLLVNVESGHCTVTLALGCEHYPVITRQAQLDLTLTIQTGNGIPLLSPAPA
jgi:hypothetical protein